MRIHIEDDHTLSDTDRCTNHIEIEGKETALNA